MEEKREGELKLGSRERDLTDEEILEQYGYSSPKVSKSIGRSRVGSFFSSIGKAIGNSKIYKAVSNSFIGRSLSYLGERTNAVLNHPGGRLATFGIAIGLGVAAVVGTGGLALIAPAVGLGAVVVGKAVDTGIDSHRDNKIRSLEHQVKLLRTLEEAHKEHTENLHKGMSEEQKIQFSKIHKSISSLSAEHSATEGEEYKRNLPTARGEAIKSAVKGAFTLASAAIDLSSLPVSAAGMARHAPDVVSKSLDIREAADLGEEVHEQLEGSEKEAALKARVNKLAKELKVPAMKNTADLADHVRTRLSLMKAKEGVARDHVAGELTREDAMMRYSAYKSDADKDTALDDKVSEQRKRGSYVKRMASSVSRALFGTKKDWQFKTENQSSKEVPDARKDKGSSISR